MKSNLEIAKNLGIKHNVSIRVIDEPTGKVVSEHEGHNIATSTLLTGLGQFLLGGATTGAGELLEDWIPQYISLGTMGLRNQDEDENGLPAGVGDLGIDSPEPEPHTEEDYFKDYLARNPGFGSDGYDSSISALHDRYLFGEPVMGLGKVFADRPFQEPSYSTNQTIECELISPSFPRSKITYRKALPESRSELPNTIDVVFSALISTGALAQFREEGKDYIFITEVGLWSRPTWMKDENGNNDYSGLNGLLAGYRIAPPDKENWDMSVEANRQLLKENIIRVGINQVVQVIWKIQLGAIDQISVERDPVLIIKSIIENGTYNASTDFADGYSSVNVNVQPPLMTKEITADGEYVAADDHVYGYDKIISTRNYITKEITADGVYVAADEPGHVDGYDKVISTRNYMVKNITADGIYVAADEPGHVDGYSKIVSTRRYMTKEITADGTYRASDDNVDGYTTVVSSRKYMTKNITADGIYRAVDDNVDGYTEVISSRHYISKSITENGTYTAASDNADGYTRVIVDVPNPTLISKTINSNGTYTASSDNADGYDTVTVSVPQLEPTLITKQITANGTYAASSDNADGYSTVTVQVPIEDNYYVEPQIVAEGTISADTPTVLSKTYFVLSRAERVQFRSTMSFTLTTASSATVSIFYRWDSSGTSSTITETYTSSGSKILTLDYLLPELSAGDHLFEVVIEVTGGTIS